jgi:hypothetical protein
MANNSQFVAQVSGLMNLNRRQLGQFQRRVNLSILRRLVLGSPVDTGRFRANWQVGVDRLPEGVLGAEGDTFDRGGGQSLSRGMETTGGQFRASTFYIVNNLPYAVPLEYGWSRQAPAGMVRITLAAHRQIIEEAWRR